MNPSRLTFSLGEAGRCHFAETNSFQLFVGILPGVSTACSDHLKTIKLRLGLSLKSSSADSERMGIKGKFLMGDKQLFCIKGFVGTEGGVVQFLTVARLANGDLLFLRGCLATRVAGTHPTENTTRDRATLRRPHADAEGYRCAAPRRGGRPLAFCHAKQRPPMGRPTTTRPYIQQRPKRRCPLSIQHTTISNEFY